MMIGTKILALSLAYGLLWPLQASSQLRESVPDHIRLLVPPSEEPLPVVLWASGCSGFFHPRAPWHYLERTQHVLSAGYAIAYVDYVSAAGYDAACGGELTLAEIARILVDAVQVLEEVPAIDPSRIVLLGSSLGAGGVLAALSVPAIASHQPVAVLALYPACEGLRTWDLDVPVWVWFAGGDQITPPSRCRAVLDETANPPTEHTYPNAEHGFDTRGLPTELEAGQAALAFDPAAADDVWARIEGVLNQVRGER